MRIPGARKTSWNSGEITREAAGRTEIKSYYSGAQAMVRVEPIPQGGFALMPGTRQIARVRGALSTLAIISWVGGAGSYAAGAEICTADAGAARTFALLDLSEISAASADMVRVEWKLAAGDAWTPFPAFSITAASRAWRGGTAPATTITARYFRLVRTGGTGPLVITPPAAFTLLSEGAAAVASFEASFSPSRIQHYDCVFSAGNIDIFDGPTFLTAVASPYAADQLAALRAQQSRATMLVFHQDVPVRKLLYQSAQDWLFGEQVFSNMPDVDLGGTYVKTPDIWRLIFVNSGNAAQSDQSTLDLTIGEETTDQISLNGYLLGVPQRDAIAADIKAKIEALANVEGPVTVVAESYTIANNYPFLITFDGAGNIGELFSMSGNAYGPVVQALRLGRIQRGDPGGEPLVSGGRGYFRDGAFTQFQRTALVAPKAKANAFLLSVLSDPFNLNSKITTADGAVLFAIDSEDEIERIVIGRHVLLFGRGAEYFIADRSISRTAPPNVVQSSRNGCAENVPVVSADDSLLFVNGSGTVVYSHKYSDTAQAYESTAVSLICAHLITGIVDAAFQKPRTATNAGRYLLVREDGVLLSGTILQGQEISGFVRWITDGAVKRVVVNGRGDIRLHVSRLINGADVLVCETMDPAMLFDQARTVTLGAAGTLVPGLEDLEGATVWALADGYVEGPFVVSGGAITLPSAATQIVVGRWTPPVMETLPPNREIAPQTVLQRPGHIASVEMQLIETTSVALGANGQPPVNVPLYAFGMPVDVPLPPRSGAVLVAGLQGYIDEPSVVITQTRPGKLQVRDITIEQRL